MANGRRGATRYLPPSTLPTRLSIPLKISELTRDRIGEGFCLMESVRHDVDRAKRRGRNSVIKPVRWKSFVVRRACPEPVRTSTSSAPTGRSLVVSQSNRAHHERIYSVMEWSPLPETAD